MAQSSSAPHGLDPCTSIISGVPVSPSQESAEHICVGRASHAHLLIGGRRLVRGVLERSKRKVVWKQRAHVYLGCELLPSQQ